jgi:hypothetical protein
MNGGKGFACCGEGLGVGLGGRRAWVCGKREGGREPERAMSCGEEIVREGACRTCALVLGAGHTRRADADREEHVNPYAPNWRGLQRMQRKPECKGAGSAGVQGRLRLADAVSLPCVGSLSLQVAAPVIPLSSWVGQRRRPPFSTLRRTHTHTPHTLHSHAHVGHRLFPALIPKLALPPLLAAAALTPLCACTHIHLLLRSRRCVR